MKNKKIPNRKRPKRMTVSGTERELGRIRQKARDAGYDSTNEFVLDRCQNDDHLLRPDREAIEVLDFQIRRLTEATYLALEKLDAEEEGDSFRATVCELRQLTGKAAETLGLIQAVLVVALSLQGEV